MRQFFGGGGWARFLAIVLCWEFGGFQSLNQNLDARKFWRALGLFLFVGFCVFLIPGYLFQIKVVCVIPIARAEFWDNCNSLQKGNLF